MNIEVEDANDNAPQFLSEPYQTTISEVCMKQKKKKEQKKDVTNILYKAFSKILFTLSILCTQVRVAIITCAYNITCKCPCIVAMSTSSYLYKLNFVPSSSTQSIANVQILTEGNFVYSVLAVDMDSGDNGMVRYSLAGRGSDSFVVDPISGDIRVSAIGVDFETIPENPLMLNVIASDLGM